MQLIRVLGPGLPLDIREMIVQRDSTQAAHSVEARPRIDELCDNYVIEDSLVDPPPRVVGVIDDVLRTALQGCSASLAQTFSLRNDLRNLRRTTRATSRRYCRFLTIHVEFTCVTTTVHRLSTNIFANKTKHLTATHAQTPANSLDPDC